MTTVGTKYKPATGARKTWLEHMNTSIGFLLLAVVVSFSVSSPASAKSVSLSRTGQSIDNELQSLGLFPEMFGAGLIAYNNGNYGRALRIWRPLAQAGHSLAQYNLGIAYARGLSVERNMLIATYWWERSALQGHRDASYNLGLVYARGEDEIAQNMVQAAHWWQQAAIRGDAIAQFNLGMMYARGEGVKRDIETAIYWWKASANQGFNGAKKMLDQIATN
ncbi:MAG: tetratricopeptide repeat protein [Acidiferrobacterales bacterium]